VLQQQKKKSVYQFRQSGTTTKKERKNRGEVSRSESCYREGERSSLLSSCLEVNLEKKKKKFFFDTFSRFLSE